MPDGALSDAESVPDDEASLDDEDLEQIARDVPTHLNVQVHKVPQHAYIVSDDKSDADARPVSATLNRQQFTWRNRKPHTAEVDATFQGPIFSPPPDNLPSTKWYFDKFMDKSVFEWIAGTMEEACLSRSCYDNWTTQPIY